MYSKTVILVASSTSTNSWIRRGGRGDLSLYSVYQQLTLRTCGRRGFAESVFPLKFDLRYHHHDYHHYDHHTIQMT